MGRTVALVTDLIQNNCTKEVTVMERFLKPKDIAEILGCSMSRAYDIVNQKDFPKIKIGKRAYIPPEAFQQWVKNYTYKTYVL
jgi:predicted DNA-binding transcriptional regulator AlpA